MPVVMMNAFPELPLPRLWTEGMEVFEAAEGVGDGMRKGTFHSTN